MKQKKLFAEDAEPAASEGDGVDAGGGGESGADGDSNGHAGDGVDTLEIIHNSAVIAGAKRPKADGLGSDGVDGSPSSDADRARSSDGDGLDFDDREEDDEDDDALSDEDEGDEDAGDEDDEGDEEVGESRYTSRAGATLRAPPPRATNVATAPRLSIFAGAVLGGAIGDAIGHPTEFIGSVAAIRSKYGPAGVTGFELFWERNGKRFAPYTDDTQMAEIVLRSLVESHDEGEGLDEAMKRMATGFIHWSDRPQGGHRAPGNACMSGARALARGAHWSEAGGATAGGCGSVMRAYPFGLVFSHDLARAERWSVAHSKLTHRDPIALAACAAMAVGMGRIVRGDPVMTVASEMVAAACRYSPTTAGMMTRAIDEALSGVDPDVTLDRLRAWAAHEAIAAAVYLFVRHPDDPSAAILEGANTPGDSDSIATLAGAMVGARCGLDAIPSAWVRDVERSQELLELAGKAAGLDREPGVS